MFSTIDVMVAQAHIDQLNELARREAFAQGRPPLSEFRHAGISRKSADPLGCGLFVSTHDDAPESYGQTFPDDFPTPP